MTWNYRLVKTNDDNNGKICEVQYDEDGKVVSIHPATFSIIEKGSKEELLNFQRALEKSILEI